MVRAPGPDSAQGLVSRAAPGWARPPAPRAAEDCSTPPFWPPGAAELGAGKARGDTGPSRHPPPERTLTSTTRAERPRLCALRQYSHRGTRRGRPETRSQSAGLSEGGREGGQEKREQSSPRSWAGLKREANRGVVSRQPGRAGPRACSCGFSTHCRGGGDPVLSVVQVQHPVTLSVPT